MVSDPHRKPPLSMPHTFSYAQTLQPFSSLYESRVNQRENNSQLHGTSNREAPLIPHSPQRNPREPSDYKSHSLYHCHTLLFMKHPKSWGLIQLQGYSYCSPQQSTTVTESLSVCFCAVGSGPGPGPVQEICRPPHSALWIYLPGLCQPPL